MNKCFNLEWDELDEDLRERKIDEYLASMEPGEIEDMVRDPREDAEYCIKARFPIYF